MTNKTITISATLLKILLGAFFVFSALSKFVDIDLLGIYIFSFGVLSLNLSTVAAWLLITIELVLGVLLITNRWHRLVCMANMLLLVFFTLFLCYAQLTGRTDSCHCMGEMLPFNPIQSMVKNAVLVVLLLVVWKFADTEYHVRWWMAGLAPLLVMALIALGGFRGWMHMTFIDLQYGATLTATVMAVAILLTTRFYHTWWTKTLLVLAPMVAIFILSVAATWIHTDADKAANQKEFSKAIATDGPLADANLTQGRKVVGIFSRTCNYCRIASQKLSIIQQNDNLDADDFVNVFPGKDTVGIAAFYQKGAIRYQEYLLDPTSSVMITYGQFPLVMLVDNGRIVATYGHGDISESQIVDFLNQE